MSEDQIVHLLDMVTMGARSLVAIAVAMWLGACSSSVTVTKKDTSDE
jgi:hypothetical protein